MSWAQFPRSGAEITVTGISKQLLTIAATQGEEIAAVMPVGVAHLSDSRLAGIDVIDFDIAGAQQKGGPRCSIEVASCGNRQALRFPEQQGLIGLVLQHSHLHCTHGATKFGNSKARRLLVQTLGTIPLFQATIM